MKIAQIAPLIESVPPRLYGGTERIVAYLTEELVRQGHEVTLFASGDSLTSAELVPCSERALRLDPRGAGSVALLHGHARRGAPARARLRRDALPYRLSAFSAVPRSCPAHADHAARAPRSARSVGGVSGLFRVPAGVDLGRSAAAVPRLELAEHGAPRAAAATPFRSRRARAAATSPSSGGSAPRSGRTMRSRSRAAPASPSRSRPRSTASIRPTSTR